MINIYLQHAPMNRAELIGYIDREFHADNAPGQDMRFHIGGDKILDVPIKEISLPKIQDPSIKFELALVAGSLSEAGQIPGFIPTNEE